jgi:replicative DNA helicase
MPETRSIDLAGRLPPQSSEAEQSVLGGIMIENESLYEVLQVLRPDDFYHETHRSIYQALISLSEKGEPADLVTLTEQLQSENALERIGGASYIARLVDSVPTAANILHYAKIVKDKAVLREMIHTCATLSTQCMSEPGDVDEFLDKAEGRIFDLSQRRSHVSFVPLAEVLKDSFQQIETLHQNKGKISGVASGFAEVDKITNGFQNSDLVIIAGRPSMGKTSFALNIAQHAALEQKTAVAIFSLEMSREQIGMRLLCGEGRVDSALLRKGELGDEDWLRLTRVAGKLSEAKIFIDDSAGLTPLEMKAKARRLKSAHNIGLIVVDYLQLMRSERRSENRVQEISDISLNLKALAKEMRVPVLALSQLNRGVDSRDNKRPQMSDLRESGAIEQDADVIAFIYRDEVYNSESPERGIAEVIIAKHRNGPIGKAKLAFLGQYTRFEDLAYEYQE